MSVQIPNYHISDRSSVKGVGKTAIDSRADSVAGGVFKVTTSVSFDPATDDYPTGNVRIDADLSDSVRGRVASTTIEQINTHGKHTPTAVITGRCRVTSTAGEAPAGCRFWLLIADNSQNGKGTPDVASFMVFDRDGNRVCYGTAPLEGNITVEPGA